jgi:hypothetical protein
MEFQRMPKRLGWFGRILDKVQDLLGGLAREPDGPLPVQNPLRFADRGLHDELAEG